VEVSELETGWRILVGKEFQRKGPTNDMNSNDDICSVLKELQRDPSHTTFILLNPRSHTAVLTGKVDMELNNDCKLCSISFPHESL